MNSTLRMRVWVRDPAHPDKHAHIDTNGNGNVLSLINRGDKWEMFLKGDDDFSSVLWACNLHLKEACISTYSALPVVVRHAADQQPQTPLGRIEQNEVRDKLDASEAVKTARLLCPPDDNLKKAIRAYSEKVVSPYPRIVFQGLFEAAEIATCRKNDRHNEAEVISNATKIKQNTVNGFKEMNNRLKHPDVKPDHKDPSLKDISDGIKDFRPKVAELLLKSVLSYSKCWG